MDYEVYGKGEALMGWYNGKAKVERLKAKTGVGKVRSGGILPPAVNKEAGGLEAHATIDGNAWLVKLARGIQRGLEKAGAEIAHFKMSLKEASGLAVVNVVANGRPAELSRKLPALLSGAAELLINVRAEAAPELIEAVVAREVKKAARTLAVEWIDQAAFRPGMPKPVHRVRTLGKSRLGRSLAPPVSKGGAVRSAKS